LLQGEMLLSHARRYSKATFGEGQLKGRAKPGKESLRKCT
jgi:hypothetical protein